MLYFYPDYNPLRGRRHPVRTCLQAIHRRADSRGAPAYLHDHHKPHTASVDPAAICAGIAFRLRRLQLDRRQPPSLRLIRELRAHAHAFAPYRRTTKDSVHLRPRFQVSQRHARQQFKLGGEKITSPEQPEDSPSANTKMNAPRLRGHPDRAQAHQRVPHIDPIVYEPRESMQGAARHHPQVQRHPADPGASPRLQ